MRNGVGAWSAEPGIPRDFLNRRNCSGYVGGESGAKSHPIKPYRLQQIIGLSCWSSQANSSPIIFSCFPVFLILEFWFILRRHLARCLEVSVRKTDGRAIGKRVADTTADLCTVEDHPPPLTQPFARKRVYVGFASEPKKG